MTKPILFSNCNTNIPRQQLLLVLQLLAVVPNSVLIANLYILVLLRHPSYTIFTLLKLMCLWRDNYLVLLRMLKLMNRGTLLTGDLEGPLRPCLL